MADRNPTVCLDRCDEDIDLLSELLDSTGDHTSEHDFGLSDDMLSNDVDDLTSYLSGSRGAESEIEDESSEIEVVQPPCRNPKLSGGHILLNGRATPATTVIKKPSSTNKRSLLRSSSDINDKNCSKSVVVVTVPKSQQCMNKSAVSARENRVKKKKYVEGLENDVKNLNEENTGLKDKLDVQDSAIKALNEEVKYLRSIIANQSTLSSLLQNIHNTAGVKLKCSLSTKENSSLGANTNREENTPNKSSRQRSKSKPKTRAKSRNEVALKPHRRSDGVV